jgi:hypothetical protein
MFDSLYAEVRDEERRRRVAAAAGVSAFSVEWPGADVEAVLPLATAMSDLEPLLLTFGFGASSWMISLEKRGT